MWLHLLIMHVLVMFWYNCFCFIFLFCPSVNLAVVSFSKYDAIFFSLSIPQYPMLPQPAAVQGKARDTKLSLEEWLEEHEVVCL